MSKLDQFKTFLESINIDENAVQGITDAAGAIFEGITINADEADEVIFKLKSTVEGRPSDLKRIFDIQTKGMSVQDKNYITTKLAEAVSDTMSENEVIAAVTGAGVPSDSVDTGEEIRIADVEIKAKPDNKTLDPVVVKANQLFGSQPEKAQALYAQAAADESINKYSRNYAKGALKYISSLAKSDIVLDEVKV